MRRPGAFTTREESGAEPVATAAIYRAGACERFRRGLAEHIRVGAAAGRGDTHADQQYVASTTLTEPRVHASMLLPGDAAEAVLALKAPRRPGSALSFRVKWRATGK